MHPYIYVLRCVFVQRTFIVFLLCAIPIVVSGHSESNNNNTEEYDN